MSSRQKRIAILVHCNETTQSISGHAISHFARIWTRLGHDVEFAHGPSRLPKADLLFLHVDLSVVPEAYLDAAQHYPRTVNLGITDIRKSVVSRYLVTEDDDYDGPVVVKTNLNHMGVPERRLLKRPTPTPCEPDDAAGSRPRGYRLFSSKAEVPERYFQDSDWVVERFLPERRDGRYHIRFCSFLGQRWSCVRRSSYSEFCVAPDFTSEREPIRPHPEIVFLRKKLGFEYGKFDYVEHDGHAVLLDANKTPGAGPQSSRDDPRIQAEMKHLALGIDEFLE